MFKVQILDKQDRLITEWLVPEGEIGDDIQLSEELEWLATETEGQSNAERLVAAS